MRRKQGTQKPEDEPTLEIKDIQIIDVADYQPPRVPSKTWRECIKKIFEIDPLCCPRCGGSMKILSFITEVSLIKKILTHLGLWKQKPSRDPPSLPEDGPAELVFEPFLDDWPPYEEPSFQIN